MKKKTKLIMTACIIAIVIAISPIVYQIVCWQIYVLDPNIVRHKKEAYQKLSSEELVKKLSFWNVWWFDTALDILAERKEKVAVPDIIELLKSSYKYKRHSAMRALAKIGDDRAIPPLLRIVKKGKKHLDYYEALYTLSKLKCEKAFPYVVELAKENDKYAINMLREFGKPDGIPLLENIRKTIRGDDTIARIYKEDIDDAIKHIKSLQKEK